MSQLHVMVGLPASGKSTFANTAKTVVLSSDKLREELLGDTNDQSNNELIFNTLYKRTEESLKSGFAVFLDATNISAKTRKQIVERFRKHADKLVAHYFNTPLYVCLRRNATRERIVPQDVIMRMYNNLQVPLYSEGWDEIIFHNPDNVSCNDYSDVKTHYESVLSKPHSYRDFISAFNFWDEIKPIIELPQDNPHHTLSVSRHTYHVWDYIRKNYVEDDQLVMLWAALFHDTGKYMTKKFKRLPDGTDSRYANFIGHENVSAQLAAQALHRFYTTDFILKVVEIVQNHMRLLSAGDNPKARSKLSKEVGEDLFEKLQIFRDADTAAK